MNEHEQFKKCHKLLMNVIKENNDIPSDLWAFLMLAHISGIFRALGFTFEDFKTEINKGIDTYESRFRDLQEKK